jgi:hypothetical protein
LHEDRVVLSKPQLAKLAPLVDELGALQAELDLIRRGQADSIREKGKREERLKALIRDAFASQPPRKGATIPGKSYTAEVGACQPRRVVRDAAKVLKLMGQRAFLKLVTIPIGALEKTLSGPDFERHVESQPVGPRSLAVRANEKQ